MAEGGIEALAHTAKRAVGLRQMAITTIERCDMQRVIAATRLRTNFLSRIGTLITDALGGDVVAAVVAPGAHSWFPASTSSSSNARCAAGAEEQAGGCADAAGSSSSRTTPTAAAGAAA